jgi:hypothetical protein
MNDVIAIILVRAGMIIMCGTSIGEYQLSGLNAMISLAIREGRNESKSLPGWRILPILRLYDTQTRLHREPSAS